MAAKAGPGQTPEDNAGSRAPVGPCAYIYAYPLSSFPTREASLLGNAYPGAQTVSLPLLAGLTVEEGFPTTVKAIHRKADLASVLVKVTSFHREVVVFHNAAAFEPIFYSPGLEELCEEARSLFGFSVYRAPPDRERADWRDLVPMGAALGDYILAVVVTEGFKERLYGGHLIPLPALAQTVSIGEVVALKTPMYDCDLFGKQTSPSTKSFFSVNLSQYLYQSLYTSIAQGLRLRNVDAVIQALEKQFVQDQYKTAKVVKYKEFPAGVAKNADGALRVADCAAAELAISYALAFVEAPQEASSLLSYSSWPIFAGADDTESRLAALNDWNARASIHAHAQLFSGNSVLYLSRVQRNTNARSDGAAFNSLFLQHGLAALADPAEREDGTQSFGGIPSSALAGQMFTPHHLAYAASFSPHLLARYCYYLQFSEHQRVAAGSQHNMAAYVGTAANTDACRTCHGRAPAVCIQTLFHRLRDRFPPVLTGQRRDPYVITGASAAYNDLDFLGSFASFRDKEEGDADAEDTQRFTYWQLNQTLSETLESLGIKEGEEPPISDIASFLRVFKDIDAAVDAEVLKFINNLNKNNVSYKESIKGVHHVLQYCCNVFWQAPCPVFLQLYYRSLLALVQDVSLPTCMLYEQENPAAGQLPSEWLRTHFQTLWTNFKTSCFDRGLITGAEIKVVNSNYCESYDFDAALKGTPSPATFQVRMARHALLAPKLVKVKNRIIFSNSGATEAIQSAFVKPPPRKDGCVVSGPYMKFLNMYHRTLFPGTRMSALFFWHTLSQKRQVPVVPGVNKDRLMELVNYVEYSSRAHEESNVLDVLPAELTTYAKLRMNNALLRACGQTQFFATTLHCLSPRTRMTGAEEYPHALGACRIESTEEYLKLVEGCAARTAQTTIQESVSSVGRLRPIVTLPVVVNKYTGINGNTQLFHCGNLGYFVGRGVDKNLLPDGASKRQGGLAHMRRRHIFMTPIVGTLVKRAAGLGTLEIENVRRDVQRAFDDMGSSVFEAAALALVKHLGPGCRDVTEDDLCYYLGPHYIMADEVAARLHRLIDAAGSDGAWTEDWASSVLSVDSQNEALEFIPFENALEPGPSAEPAAPRAPARKRKIGALLGDVDL